MASIKKILCPVDFSDSSNYALDLAVDLADRFSAQLFLLHAYQIPVYAVPQVGAPGSQPVATSLDVPKQLEEMLEQTRKERARPGMDVQTKVVEGVPYQVIVEQAEELATDMVVMGTHGRTGLSHLLIGSVAERVVRTSKRPVLTVRKPESK